MYYTIYKTTNIVNNKIYIGKHETDNLDDGYLGSGTWLKNSINKYGSDKFIKEILYIFKTYKEMNDMESKIVDEDFIRRKDTYNIMPGGYNVGRNMVTVKDENGLNLYISKNDDRWISGKLVSSNKNMVAAKDLSGTGTGFYISKEDSRWVLGELVSVNKGKTQVKDNFGNRFYVSIDDYRYLSGELVGVGKNMVTVKNINNEIFYVSIDDYRYLSGELTPVWKGNKHSEETKIKIGKANSINRFGNNNSNFGKCWIHNLEIKKTKSIKKEELEEWLKLGWIKGNKIFNKKWNYKFNPPKEELIKKLEEFKNNITEVGRYYKTSRNTIIRFCKRFEIKWK